MDRLLAKCGWLLTLMVAGTVAVSADDASAISSNQLHEDWLKPVEEQQYQAQYGTFSTAAGVDLSDPFAVISSGSLWQDKQSVTYSRAVMDRLTLNCSTSSVTQDGSPDQLGGEVRAESVYQPLDAITIKGNLHSDSSDVAPTPVETNGAGASVETHLPLGTTFTAAVDSDQARSDNNPGLDFDTKAYDAQVQKPIGHLPVNLVLKGHLVETDAPGTSATKLPSFEQSLLWKAGDNTTLQAGLRQQQYQNFPGIDNELDEALFADWSQKLAGDNFTWHSYAEMINTRSTVEITQAPTGTAGVTQPVATQASTLPVSLTDEKVTFSTGPSIQLQKDLSASVQYSASWDQAPAAGTAGQEQRVSVSLKGSF